MKDVQSIILKQNTDDSKKRRAAFIRKKKAPDIPIATVEYSLERKQVLQCRGEHNKTPQKSLLNFVNDMWLPYANNTLKQISA